MAQLSSTNVLGNLYVSGTTTLGAGITSGSVSIANGTGVTTGIVNILSGAVAGSSTRVLNLGSGGAGTSTTTINIGTSTTGTAANINIGTAAKSTTTINGILQTGSSLRIPIAAPGSPANGDIWLE